MNVNESMALGLLALVVGLSGWLIPYRYNLLRLRRAFSGALSREANERVPKIVGSLLIAAGLVLVLGSLLGATEGAGDRSAERRNAEAARTNEPSDASGAKPAPSRQPTDPMPATAVEGAAASPPARTVDADVPSLSVDEANTRLLKLAAGRDAESIRAVVAAGADPDTRSEEGWTALLIAIDYESLTAIDALLRAGADPDLPVTGEYGGSPLFYAVLTGNSHIVRRLVEAGADLETRSDIDQLTPLLTAVSTGERDIARYLVAHGADTSARDRDGVGIDGYLDESTLEEYLEGP